MQRLSQSGRWIIDGDGRAVLLHGGNVTLPTESGTGERVIWSDQVPARMAEQGFNAVRLVIFLSELMPRPGVIDDTYLDRIERTVSAYGAAGIRTLIDFHQDEYSALVGVRGMPEWAVFTNGVNRMPGLQFPMGYFKDPAVQLAFDNFWVNHPVAGTGKGVQDLYIDALSAVAGRFRDTPWVLGIDVMNEPATGTYCTAPDPEAWAKCTDLEQELLAPFYEHASRAIASAAPGMLIFVEPFMLQGAIATTIKTPIVAPAGSRGLSFHNYGPVKVTRDKVSDSALARAVEQRAAILNTEWGFDNDPSVIDMQASDFDARLISWLAWPRGAFEALVDADLDNRDNGNRLALLRAYARPFPQAIAGTPLALDFKPESGTMKLEYRTRLPSRSRAGSDLETVIVIPPVNFPHGYKVEVKGAKVVSQVGTSRLRLRNLPGAETVKVTVARVGSLEPLADMAGAGNLEVEALRSLPPISAARLSRSSLLGHIILTPGGREVLENQVPGLTTGIKQLHGWERMTLVQIQQLAGGALNAARMAALDAALAGLAVRAGPAGQDASRSLSVDSFVSDLLADPRARAVIEREAPGLATAPEQALFPQTRLRDLQPLMPRILSDEALARIAKALAAPD